MIRSKNGLSLDCSNIVLLTALQGIENRTLEESYIVYIPTYLCLGPCQQLIAVTRMQVREDDINIFRQLDVTSLYRELLGVKSKVGLVTAGSILTRGSLDRGEKKSVKFSY